MERNPEQDKANAQAIMWLDGLLDGEGVTPHTIDLINLLFSFPAIRDAICAESARSAKLHNTYEVVQTPTHDDKGKLLPYREMVRSMKVRCRICDNVIVGLNQWMRHQYLHE